MTAARQKVTGRAPVPRASVLDTVKVAAVVFAPAIARGVIARRPRIVALAERMDADRKAGRLLRRLRARHGPGPLRLSIPGRSFALVLTPEHVARVLTGPEFAAANREKRSALAHFQPHGVLASTGADRVDRRRFNERVLDTPHEVHTGIAGSVAAKVHQEATELLGRVETTGTLEWDEFRRVWWRVIRRVVLGDAARDDHEVSDLLTRLRMNANWGFAHPRRDRLRHRFEERLHTHLARAEPGSLAGVMARTPVTARTDPEQQVPQWLFAFEPAGMAAFRALALLATHPDEAVRARAEIGDLAVPQDLPYLRACVLESVRLWPTTMAILRDTTEETEWGGRTLPAGTGLLIHTPSLQRDEEYLTFADAFAPETWRDGTAEAHWSAIPFSAGPAECPGRNLVLLTTSLFLGTLLHRHDFRLASGQPLAEGRPVPRTLSPFRLRFDVRPATADVPDAVASA
ncbi:cytochrome P450 [Actinomadura kijaniata]|uniref:cytochrome P450 n=1 Tax=Actinomadura kijaniata TaxID=46161 RepID=UPI0008298BED|nr:cytochrome P450 [Actinomadura kijaniata]